MGLLEGSYLAMRNELKIGDEVYKMHKGSNVRLYLPSSIAYGEAGSSAEGGYEGQYALDASRPLILDVEVLGVIKNPSDMELEMVQQYIGYEGLWTQAVKPESEKVDENDDLKLKGLHYNLNYNPATDDANSYKYLQPHCMNVADKLNNPYTDNRKYAVGKMAEINEKINEIMLKRFGKGLEVSKQSEKTQVTKNGRAKVWYVLRFLDGFVVDTNIAEIRTLMFDEANPDCEVFSYSPSDDEGKEEGNRQAIGAWYYCIPSMHYGAYAQIITTSGYAYGASGLSGTTTTTESSSSSNMANYYNAMNYYNYYNSYYNYYSPYYNYYDYNYYNYNYNVSEEEVTSTKTISTEILPYTPLVFTLYVEPYE
jgi:FKBP-type peptidyl-prolyl cis-trans isomerase